MAWITSPPAFADDCICILIRYRNLIAGNDKIFNRFLLKASEKFRSENIVVVELHHHNPNIFETELFGCLARLPRASRAVAVDISGMPSYAVCSTLKAIRDLMVGEPQTVLYTSAAEYNPTFVEYERLTSDGREEIELLPRSMALEMAENLVLDSFSGYRSHSAKVCLAIFAGYEAHRSTGVVEAVNPALLLLLYGRPGDERLSWRLDLSRKLHKKFERGRPTAVEVVSTLQIAESLNVLNLYYDNLIDEYDLVISPISSKMQAVAAYLFWEQFGEVQLSFPIPIGYNIEHRPTGVAATYFVTLPPRLQLFTASDATDER